MRQYGAMTNSIAVIEEMRSASANVCNQYLATLISYTTTLHHLVWFYSKLQLVCIISNREVI